MWLCGHKHFYERSAPAFAGKVDAAGGMVQVVNGAAGNNEGVECLRLLNEIIADFDEVWNY